MDDYNVSLEGKPKDEQGLAYFHEVEEFLKTPNLIVREDGTMNNQEPSILFLDKDSGLLASFEKNLFYDKYHFISSYEIDEDALKEFIRTGNIGASPAERQAEKDWLQRLQAAA